MIIKKFLKLVNKRDALMEKHCKNQSWAELSNYPEERAWYTETISPLDKQIINIANLIVAKFNLPCKKIKTIAEAYANQSLYELVKGKIKPNNDHCK